MTTELLESEHGSTALTSESPAPHWIDDCPKSTLQWWFPLVLSATIYLINIFYILGRYLLAKMRPTPTPHSTAYPNIFRGIEHSAVEEDVDQSLEQVDEDIFQSSQSQWLNEGPWSDSEDFKFPSTSGYELSPKTSAKLDQSENEEEDNDNGDEVVQGKIVKRIDNRKNEPKRKANFITLQLENEEFSQNKTGAITAAPNVDRKRSGKRTRLFGSNKERLGFRIRVFCEEMTSVSYPTGRFMLVVYVLLCTISWIIYIIGTIILYTVETQDDVIEALQGRPPLVIQGLCLTPGLAALSWSDLVIHSYFLIYFILRLGAAVDRSKFFFKITSIVDVVTICGAFCSAAQPRYHLDLGFLRALNIFNFGEVLSYLGILSSNHVIETVDIFFTMFAMWMVASGLIHLIIHIGDFWKVEHKALSWNYLDCCYFLLVTMSTVGFGDFYPITTLGRLYICVFIPVAMGIFAVFVPAIFRKVSAGRVQSDSYQALAGHQHVVVCGHFNNISLSAVLRGFFHIEHSSRRRLVNMVILRVSPIDLALRAILTKYNAWVKYYQGTPADPQDLARICFRSSQGALVLATPNSGRSVDEDGGNIMQAIALKAHSQRIRVLVQLHHFKNKYLLYNFPRWTGRNKDMVICMDELKLGLMALNSLAPGFSTIILNLLNGHRVKNVSKQTSKEKWRTEYEDGVAMEIYDVNLSYEFHNLCAQELILFAYEKWDIVLCALYCTEPEKPSIIINPAIYRDLNINSLNMKAIVIATNSIVVNRMRNYCTKCRAHETGEACQCPARLQFFINAAGMRKEKEYTATDEDSTSQMPEDEDIASEPFLNNTQVVSHETPADHAIDLSDTSSSATTLRKPPLPSDCCSRFTVSSALNSTIPKSLVPKGIYRPQSMGHNFTESSPAPYTPYIPKYVDSTGWFHWVPDTPIEKIKLIPSEAMKYQFRDHYLLCIVGPLAGGSLNLRSYVFPLRFHWMDVKDIVVLGDTSVIDEEEWEKVKNIPHVFLVQGNPCSLNDLNAVRLKLCKACTILGESANENVEDQCLRDQNTLLCAMTIRSMIEKSPRNIHMTTELHCEQNTHHFSSAESHNLDFKLPLRFQEAFARGIVFSNTLLYSSISSVSFSSINHIATEKMSLVVKNRSNEIQAQLYFSGAVHQFLRVLLFGAAVEEVESNSMLQSGLLRGNPSTIVKATGVRVALVKMSELPFGTLFIRPVKVQKKLRYKDVFTHALMCWRILCLGIYRLDRRGFRVVITNPPKSLKIHIEDQMFCFIPSEFNIASEDALSSVSSPSIDSSAIFQRTPGATYAGMSANELARQSAIMLRNVPCNDGQC